MERYQRELFLLCLSAASTALTQLMLFFVWQTPARADVSVLMTLVYVIYYKTD